MEVSVDGFQIGPDTPHAASQAWLNHIIAEVAAVYDWQKSPRQQKIPARQTNDAQHEVLKANFTTRIVMLHAICERMLHLAYRAAYDTFDVSGITRNNRTAIYNFYYTIDKVMASLLRSLISETLPLSPADIQQLIENCIRAVEFDRKQNRQHLVEGYVYPLLNFLMRYPEVAELSPTVRPLMDSLYFRLKPNWTHLNNLMGKLYGYHTWNVMMPGSQWTNHALTDLRTMEPEERAPWLELLRFANTARESRPTQAWLKKAEALRQKLRPDTFPSLILRWLSFFTVAEPHSAENYAHLHGMIFLLALADPNEPAIYQALEHIATELGNYGQTLYRHSCYTVLQTLATRQALLSLVRLQTTTNNRPSIQYLNRILTAEAARQGLTPHDLADITTPTYDIDTDGILRRCLGEFTAMVSFEADKPVWRWLDAQGKTRKTMPPQLKSQYAEMLTKLKSDVAEIEKMREFQRERIEQLYRKIHWWKLGDWQARYIEHPLLGGMARRLIWQLTLASSGQKILTLWREGRLEDIEGNALPVETLDRGENEVRVELWHPVGTEVETVLRWRVRLDELGIVQPMMQAHREAYLLTDAERATHLYSNRFAAHIIRQFVFHRHCKRLGWNNRIRVVDGISDKRAVFPLPDFGMQAELWIEPVDDPRRNESGSISYNYLSTDQVRFRKLQKGRAVRRTGSRELNQATNQGIDQDAVPLEEVDPRLFWEIMRDVDSMVARASIANDPTWQDRGITLSLSEGAQLYTYAGKELGAPERHAMLEKLLPRLQIASRCELTDKYLIVRGDVRTYKIHLGSGNILMEPNDQYLCIIRSRTDSKEQQLNPAALNFDGDSTLSLIISKAALLASDSTITDPVILGQIHRK